MLYQTMTKSEEKIVVATYVCDFGNIVINSSKKRMFKITNYSQILPLEFVFESKYYKSQGFSISNERVKILPGEQLTITITYQTKKNNHSIGKIQPINLPIDVKHGPKYMLQLLANITIPDIRIENEVEVFDFGKVLIGQRKTLYLRFLNEKEVVCDWNLSSRQDLTQAGGGDRESKFILTPTAGVILPQHKDLVSIMFIPSAEKPFTHKFTIIIKENSTPKAINVKGTGISVNLEFLPMEIFIGPVLPYEKAAFGVLQIINPSEHSTELTSIDFDPIIYEEEGLLANYPEFDTQEPLYFPVREPGSVFWDFVAGAVAKKQRKESLLRQLEACESEEDKIGIDKLLEEFQDEGKVAEYPKKVEEKHMHHVIVWGPKGSGKSYLVKNLAKEHKRAVVNMNELLQWNLSQKTKASEKASKYLEERQKDLENIKSDRDKLIKKAGKKGKQKEEELGLLDESPYYYLSEEILEELLYSRIIHPECNAGIFFDNLEAKEYPNVLIAIKLILKGLNHHTVQLLLLEPGKDSSGYDIDKLIEWDSMEKTFIDKPTINPIKKKVEKGGKANIVKPPGSANGAVGRKKGEKKTEENKEEASNIPALFDVFNPRDFAEEEEKLAFEGIRQEIIDLMYLQLKESMKEHLEIPKRTKFFFFFNLIIFYKFYYFL